MWRTVGITFKGNRGDGNQWSCRQPLFQIVILRLAFSQSEPPAIIMDRNRDVVGVVERGGAAIEGGIIEIPFG